MFHRTSFSRWLAVLVAVTSIGVAAGCGSSDDKSSTSGSSNASADKKLDKVPFQLSWLPGGDNLGFWAGDAKGIYAAHGIDIDIKHSNDPTLSIKLVASGQVPMGIAYQGDILYSAAKGQRVVALYALTNKSPFGLVSLKKANINTPKDLVGKTVGVTSLPTDQAFFNHMLQTAGVNPKDVKVVDPGQGGIQQVINGNLAATSAIVDYEPAVLASKGIKDYNFMYYADYGAPDPPFYSIVANPDWLKTHGDVAKRFIAATEESFEWTDAHTADAAAIFVKKFPDQDPALTADIWTRESKIRGDGSNDEETWSKLQDFFVDAKLTPKPVDVNTLFSNDYK